MTLNQYIYKYSSCIIHRLHRILAICILLSQSSGFWCLSTRQAKSFCPRHSSGRQFRTRHLDLLLRERGSNDAPSWLQHYLRWPVTSLLRSWPKDLARGRWASVIEAQGSRAPPQDPTPFRLRPLRSLTLQPHMWGMTSAEWYDVFLRQWFGRSNHQNMNANAFLVQIVEKS